MNYKTLALSFLAIIAALSVIGGCDKPTATSEQINKLQAETKATTLELTDQDYPFAKKAEFTAKLKAQLAEINRDLDQLAAKIETASTAAKAEAQPKLQALREQAAKLNTQLDGTQNATESTWDTVKTGSKLAYAELRDGFTQMRAWVSEKIAP